MNSWIALIRGINVGGKHLLPMKELVELFESQGHTDVRTYIQSGNVVFRNPREIDAANAAGIEQAIEARKGFRPRVLILGLEVFQQAVDDNPFPTDSGKALHFFFFESEPANADLAGLESVQARSEQFHLGQHAFYLFAPDGLGRSKLATRVERCLGVPVTARNWNTVSKLVSMASE